MTGVYSGLRVWLVAAAMGSIAFAFNGKASAQKILLPQIDVTTQKSWEEAITQGDVMLQQGEIHGDVAKLAQAVEIFTQQALPILRRESRAKEWAETQAKLGRAHLCIGALSKDLSHFEQATVAFRLALEVISREASPTNWAGAQNNLGGARLGIGKLTKQIPNLKEAETAFRLALEIYTVEAAPKQWAEAKTNLGITHFLLGDYTGDTAYYSSARDELLSAQPLLAKHAAQSVAIIVKQVEQRIPAS